MEIIDEILKNQPQNGILWDMISNISEFDTNATDNELVRLPTTEPRFFSAFVECILGEDNQKSLSGAK